MSKIHQNPPTPKGIDPSDIDDLKYLFQRHLISVERGKPNPNTANTLKLWIDVIQAKSVKQK